MEGLTGWLRRVLVAYRDRPDHVWKATGIRRTFDGHDQTKAAQSAKRAEVEVDQRRQAAVTRSGVAKAQTVPVTPFQKRARG